jgi:hypothetical protein
VIDGCGVQALAAAVLRQCLLDARCAHIPGRAEAARAWLFAERNEDRLFWCWAANLPEHTVMALARQALRSPTRFTSRRAA